MQSRDTLANLLGLWKDDKGSTYELEVEREGHSLTVTTIRPDGTMRCTPGLIRLEVQRGIQQVTWGKAFVLQHNATAITDSICWAPRDPRKRSFKWLRIRLSDQTAKAREPAAAVNCGVAAEGAAILLAAASKAAAKSCAKKSVPEKSVAVKVEQSHSKTNVPEKSPAVTVEPKRAAEVKVEPEKTSTIKVEPTGAKVVKTEPELIEIGSRVEAMFKGTWYIGIVRHLPAADKDKKNRYAVQCDVDKPGILTKTATVRLVQVVQGKPAHEKAEADKAKESDAAQAAAEVEKIKLEKAAAEKAALEETALAEISAAAAAAEKAAEERAEALRDKQEATKAEVDGQAAADEKAACEKAAAEKKAASEKAEADAQEAARAAEEKARQDKELAVITAWEKAEAAKAMEERAALRRAEAAAAARKRVEMAKAVEERAARDRAEEEQAAEVKKAEATALAQALKAAEERAAKSSKIAEETAAKKKAEAEAEAREKAEAEKVAALEKAEAAQAAREKAAREKANAEKIAREKAAVAKAAESRAAAEKASHKKAEAEKDALEEETTKALREKEAAEKELLEKVAAEKSAIHNSRAANLAYRKAGFDTRAVEGLIAERTAAIKLAQQAAAASLESAANLMREQDEIQKVVVQKDTDIKDVLDTIKDLRASVAKMMEEKIMAEVQLTYKSDARKAAFENGMAQEKSAREIEEEKHRAVEACADLFAAERSLKKKAAEEEEVARAATLKRRSIEKDASEKAKHYKSLADEMAKKSKTAAERKRVAEVESFSAERALNQKRAAESARIEKAREFDVMVRKLSKLELPTDVTADLANSLEDESSLIDLTVGDKVLRKGQEAIVVKIDRTLEPPDITVRMMADGREVGTELRLLRKALPCSKSEVDSEAGRSPGMLDDLEKPPGNWDEPGDDSVQPPILCDEVITVDEENGDTMKVEEIPEAPTSVGGRSLISVLLAQPSTTQSNETPDIKSKSCLAETPGKTCPGIKRSRASSTVRARGSVSQVLGPLRKRRRQVGTSSVWPLSLARDSDEAAERAIKTELTVDAKPERATAPETAELRKCVQLLQELPATQRHLPACSSYCSEWLSKGHCHMQHCSYWHPSQSSACMSADDPFKLRFDTKDHFKKKCSKYLREISKSLPERRCFVLDGRHGATVRALERKLDEILVPSMDLDAAAALQDKCLTACSTPCAALEAASKCGVTFGCFYLDYMWPLDYFEKRTAALAELSQRTDRGDAIKEFLQANLSSFDGFQDIKRLFGDGSRASSLLSAQGALLAVTVVYDVESPRKKQQVRLERVLKSGCRRLGFSCTRLTCLNKKGCKVVTFFYAMVPPESRNRRIAPKPKAKAITQKKGITL